MGGTRLTSSIPSFPCWWRPLLDHAEWSKPQAGLPSSALLWGPKTLGRHSTEGSTILGHCNHSQTQSLGTIPTLHSPKFPGLGDKNAGHLITVEFHILRDYFEYNKHMPCSSWNVLIAKVIGLFIHNSTVTPRPLELPIPPTPSRSPLSHTPTPGAANQARVCSAERGDPGICEQERAFPLLSVNGSAPALCRKLAHSHCLGLLLRAQSRPQQHLLASSVIMGLHMAFSPGFRAS